MDYDREANFINMCLIGRFLSITGKASFWRYGQNFEMSESICEYRHGDKIKKANLQIIESQFAVLSEKY